MKRIIIFLILCSINVFPFYSQEIDSFELDKYQWRKEKSGEFVYFKPAVKKESEIWLKILYHLSSNDFVTFDIFRFDQSCEWKSIVLPFYGFEEMSSYKKNSDNDSIIGIYKGRKKSIIDYFEIKEVNKQFFPYIVRLPEINMGYHLLYKVDNVLKSDSTFGIWKNFFFDELIKVDRSESFYISNNYQNELDDRFSISVSDYDDVFKKLTIKTEKSCYNVFPSEFYISEGDSCSLSELKPIYDKDSFESSIGTMQETQNVQIIKKKNKWIFENNRYTMWFQIKLPDSRIVWVTGKSLYKELK